MDDKYTEDIAVNVIWVKEDGMRVPVISQEFTFSFGIIADEAWEEGEIKP